MANAMLKVRDLSMRFGGLLAVNGVALDVNEREIISVIGPNGAGKTTVFNCISGFYTPTGGNINYKGQEIHTLADFGSRPRNSTNSSIGSREPPCSSTACKNSLPVFSSKTPFSSNFENASAANTSAHL